jgi:S1-C subfamily serine protease
VGVTAIDGSPVATLQDLMVYLDDETQVGDQVELTIVRGGRQSAVKVTLGERPQQQ